MIGHRSEVRSARRHSMMRMMLCLKKLLFLKMTLLLLSLLLLQHILTHTISLPHSPIWRHILHFLPLFPHQMPFPGLRRGRRRAGRRRRRRAHTGPRRIVVVVVIVVGCQAGRADDGRVRSKNILNHFFLHCRLMMILFISSTSPLVQLPIEALERVRMIDGGGGRGRHGHRGQEDQHGDGSPRDW